MPTPEQLVPRLSARAGEVDRTGRWPADDLADLASIGAMKWALPREFGGDDLSALELYLQYETIASGSLALALILSQRDSAVDLIESAPCAFRERWLGEIGKGNKFVTIGIAQ